MKRKLISLVMALVLLTGLSSCSGNGEETATTAPVPNYVVETLSDSLGLKAVSSMKMNPQGQPVLYDKGDGSNRYLTVDPAGKVINEIKCDFTGDGSAFALDKDSNLYILVQNVVIEENGYRVKENAQQLLVYDSKGKKLKGTDLGKVTMQTKEEIFVRSISIDSRGNLWLVKYNESPELIDSNGKAVKTSISGVYEFFDIDENDNIIAGTSSAEGVKPYIACMDSKSGKELWKNELGVGSYIRSICYNRMDKCTYALVNNGVCKYDSKGKPAGTVLDFMKYNLVKDGTYINGMGVDSSSSLYAIVGDKESVQVKKFKVGDATAQSPGNANPKGSQAKKKITLAAHFSDEWLQAAVASFQSSHPDIEIDVKDFKGAYYGGGDTPEEARKRQDEFVKSINTEMMAGKGPDILYFSDLPYRKYIDKNMFANLSDLMEKDSSFNKEELNTNILDALKYKDALYVIPVNFQFELMIASKPILDKEQISIDDKNWTWSDFMQIAQKVSKDTNNDGTIDQYATYTMNNWGIFPYMYSSKYEEFINPAKKEAYFTGKDFISMLNSCKAFNDKKTLFEAKDAKQINEALARGGLVFQQSGVPSYFTVGYYKSDVFNSDITMLRLPSDKPAGARGIEFSPGSMLAINSKSKYREESWELIKSLLSKEKQSATSMQNGFPINNEALKVSASMSTEYLHIKKEDIDAVNQYISDVKVYQYSDNQVSSIVRTEVRDFFAGKKSAEETAKIVQNKVTILLNE